MLDIPEKNKEFNDWFKKLTGLGVFVFVARKARGCRNNVFAHEYIVDVPKLVKYAKGNPLYVKSFKFFSRGRVL